MKLIRLHVGAVYFHQQFIDAAVGIFIVFIDHSDNGHLAVEMVEDDDVPIKDVVHFGCVVLLHRDVLDRYVLEVAHSIECSVAVKSAEIGCFSCHLEV